MLWLWLVACGGSTVDTELNTALEVDEDPVSDWDAGAAPEMEPKPGDWETSAFAEAVDTCNFEEVGVDVAAMAPVEHVVALEDEEGFFVIENDEHEAWSTCEVRGTEFRCSEVDVPYQHPFGNNIQMAFTWTGVAAQNELVGPMEVALSCQEGCDLFETVGLTFPCTVSGTVQLSLVP